MDGGGMGNNPGGRLQRSGKLWQGNIPILRHRLFKKGLMSRKFAMARRATLCLHRD
jgi:hypothetical protein